MMPEVNDDLEFAKQQLGFEAETPDGEWIIKICPRGEVWAVTTWMPKVGSYRLSAREDHREHIEQSLESAKSWVAGELEAHDGYKGLDLQWRPTACL